MTEERSAGPSGMPEPTFTAEDLASAILEVASIQVDMMRELERALEPPRRDGLRLGPSIQPARPRSPFQPGVLLRRSQLLIEWLLERLPTKQGAAE